LVRVSAIHHFSFFIYSAQVLFISLIRKDFFFGVVVWDELSLPEYFHVFR
jgi:hypothetical protein